MPIPPELYRAVFEASPLPIMVADDAGNYLAVNKAAEELLGERADAIVGRNVSEFVAPMRMEDTKHQWSEFRDRGHQSGEFRVSRRDGTDRLIRFAAVTNILPGVHLSVAQEVSADGA